MRFAYADPPYLGWGARYYGDRHPDAAEYDRPEKHGELVAQLDAEYDGWALSLSAPSLRAILPLCPPDVRVGAWVKPFASFKPGVHPAYAWEPVIFKPLPRKRSRTEPTVADYVSARITFERGMPGAKPESFAYWLFGVAGLTAADEFVDLFPGSGAVARAWEAWRGQLRWTA